MDLAVVHELVERIDRVDVSTAAREALTAGIGDVRRLISWARAREITFVGALAKVSSFPEKDVADAARTNLADGTRAMERADTAAAMPELAAALAHGDIATEHIDAAGRARRRLDPSLRPGLEAQSALLAAHAAVTTPDEFARILNRAARRLEEAAGIDRLQRQRQANSLKVGVNPVTGMFEMRGSFDPLTGATLAQRLNEALTTRMTQPTPADCPKDPFAKMDWLRAMALIDIVTGVNARPGPGSGSGSGSGSGAGSGASIIVVVDATESAAAGNEGRPVIDWGIPVEIPDRVLHDLATDPDTDIAVVVVRNGIILHAPGQLDLGRTTRLANRAQRRALRALYPTCAVPGCTTHFTLCVIHHIIWWRHGGRTDLHNLIPLCIHHHHAIHDRGWTIHLSADRTLTITLPDGRTMSTGPPRTNAA